MTCPSCGRSNPEGAVNCGACGGELSDKTRSGSRTEFPTVAPGTASTDTSAGGSASAGRMAPGARLGPRYEILSILGQGGMGAVYKAQDLELNRTVALKVIRPEMASRPEVLERFKREILLASQVTHKNVLRIHDLGEAGDVKFISMQYVEGTNLKLLLEKEGPLPAERALPLLRQIAEALRAAHEAGVVHRDLKPPNILLDGEGTAYIADFGISRSLDTGGTMTDTGMLIGTIDYMSPEQARGETPDHRSDIYSLGVMIYEILTGRLPFVSTGSTLSVLMKRIHEDAPPVKQSRPEVPGWLSGIVARAMQRDAAARYQSVDELLRDLDRQKAAVAWRRLVTWKTAATAAAALVIALSSLAYLLRAKGSAPSAAAPPSVSLAVFPFKNATGDSHYDWVRTGLPDLLRSDLMQSKALRLAAQDRLQEILDGLKVAEGEESRPALLQRIAGLIGTDNVVTANLMKAGDLYRIEATVTRITPGSATAGKPIRLQGTGEASIFSMVDDLTRKVKEDLGLTRARGEPDREATDLSTKSVEALRLYSEGLALSRAGNHMESASRLEAALEKDPRFPVARALLAETYDRLGRADRAVSESEKAAQGLGDAASYEAERIRAVRARLSNDLESAERFYKSVCEMTPNSSEAFFDLASVQEQRGDLDRAYASLLRTVELDPKHPDARYALGRVLVKLGRAAEALQEFNTALSLHLEADNEEGRATVLNGLGMAYMNISRFGEALKNFQESLDIRKRISDKRGIRVGLINVASILSIQGRYEEAIKAAQEALGVAKELGDLDGLAYGHSNLGDIYQQAGRAEDALAAYHESLKIARDLGDDAGLARTFSSIGYIDSVLGRYVEAFIVQKDALDKRRKIGDKREILHSLIDIAVVEQVQGRYDEALKYCVEAMGLSREIGERQSDIVLKANLSNIQEDQGEYGTALSQLAEAETLSREIDDKTLIATTLAYAGSTRCHLGDLAGALKALDEAARLAREMGNDALLEEILIHQGEAFLSSGDASRAAGPLREATALAGRTKDRRLSLMARLQAARASRSLKEIEAVAKEAATVGLSPLVAPARLILARIHLEAGRPSDAAQAAKEAISAASPLKQRDFLLQAHHLAARSLKKQGRLSDAADQIASALEPLEAMLRNVAGPDRGFLTARADVAAFRAEAEELLRSQNRTRDLERLAASFQPVP